MHTTFFHRATCFIGSLMLMSHVDLPSATAASSPVSVYFGTYTGKASKGIYLSHLDLANGHLSDPTLVAETQNPGFLSIHPNKKFLYSVGEMEKGGGVNAWSIDPKSGMLTKLNAQSSGGTGPTHLVVDRDGKNVLVANYSGGSVACLPINPDGTLRPASAFVQHTGSSVNRSRQEAPHAHGIYTDPANRFVFVPDLGLDQLKIYRFDAAKGTLTPNDPAFASVAPGSGPRHFGFDPKGRFGFVINEMVCTMTAFNYDATVGKLTEIHTVSTLPQGVSVQPSYSTAEVFVHPSGKFLYGSNRGHDTIAVFSIDPQGHLKLIENEPTQAKIPRGFGIDPTGQYLIAGGQSSDNAFVFRIDQKTGHLEPTGQKVSVGSPVCVEFLVK